MTTELLGFMSKILQNFIGCLNSMPQFCSTIFFRKDISEMSPGFFGAFLFMQTVIDGHIAYL